MTTWCPASTIRFKALGLHWREGKLLAAEVLDDAGRVKGVRLLGGSDEFGETPETAVIREFHKELGVTEEVIGPPVFMENIYTHEGSFGHELIAIFDVKFANAAYDTVTRIQFHENSGTICFAEWFSLVALDQPDRPCLYPDGLKAHLLSVR